MPADPSKSHFPKRALVEGKSLPETVMLQHKPQKAPPGTAKVSLLRNAPIA